MKELVKALNLLTIELKRFNDANEPKTAKRSREADYFIAGSPEELEKRQLHEELEALTPAGGIRRSQAGQKRGRP